VNQRPTGISTRVPVAPVRLRTAAVLLTVLLGGACGGPAASPGGTPTGPAASPSGTSLIGGSPTGPVAFADLTRVRMQLMEVAGGFSQPLFVTHAGDGGGQVYVVEQGGTVVLLDREGRPVAEKFLDIAGRVSAGGERGLLGLAFHPGFRLNGRVFVNYTDRNGDTVVSEFHATATRADANSERLLLKIDQPYANHNGGWIGFGPDRNLYIGMGDGGSGGDPHNNGQRKDTLLGKMLRLDVDRGDPYGIPAGNPFAGQQGSRPEIWDYGLRNPWRNSFDRETGDLFIGDVGQNRLEELNVQPSGKGGLNFGWNIMEGDACFRQDPCDRSGLSLPVFAYGRGEGTVITGGYVYRGKQFPFFAGAYVFGDYASGTIWAFKAADALAGPVQPVKLLDAGMAISSFGEDEAGELYVTDLSGGKVHRIVVSVG
jgi:glucose/arabinose dehydrogenase